MDNWFLKFIVAIIALSVVWWKSGYEMGIKEGIYRAQCETVIKGHARWEHSLEGSPVFKWIPVVEREGANND